MVAKAHETPDWIRPEMYLNDVQDILRQAQYAWRPDEAVWLATYWYTLLFNPEHRPPESLCTELVEWLHAAPGEGDQPSQHDRRMALWRAIRRAREDVDLVAAAMDVSDHERPGGNLDLWYAPRASRQVLPSIQMAVHGEGEGTDQTVAAVVLQKPEAGQRLALSAREALDLATWLDAHRQEIRRLAGEPEEVLPF